MSTQTTAPDLQRKNKFRFRAEWGWAYFLIAPTIIGLLVLNIYPFFDSINMSLYRSRGLGPMRFVGLGNYEQMFQDPQLWRSTWNTLYFMLLTVPLGVFLALVMAVLLNNKIKGRTVYRGIYFLPLVVAPAATAMVWRWIFNAEIGVLNQLLKVLGITGPNWLSDSRTAIISAAIITIWSSIGYDMVLILSGLQSISNSYYEASEIDGANGIQRFFRITVPLISPTLFFVIMMRVMSAIKQFDTVYMLIKPENPAYPKTITLMVMFYREAFEKFNKGYASAIVLWSFAIIMLITAFQFWAEKKLVTYD